MLFPAVSLACGILVYAAPGLATWLLEHLTHSRWQFSILPFDATTFIVGLAAWAVIGTVFGALVEKICGCCRTN